MSENDQYNGWANRETWTLQMWLSNDQGIYNMTRERVAEAVTAASLPAGWGVSEEDANLYFRRVAGDAVKSFWGELTDPDEGLMTAEAILLRVRDVGSVWRVDWDEIGAAWLDDGS